MPSRLPNGSRKARLRVSVPPTCRLPRLPKVSVLPVLWFSLLLYAQQAPIRFQQLNIKTRTITEHD